MSNETTTTSKPRGAPIVRQKLSDQVFDRLWDMIVSGELAPGDAMPSERALMERFEVGRPAVREALQNMANKGLITISHGERSRVNKLSASSALEQVDEIAKLLLSTEPSNLDHLKQLRKILEAGTVRLAAEHCSPEDILELRAILEKQRSYADEPEAFVQTDIAFHVRLAKTTGNPLLQGVTQAMLSWLSEYYTPLLQWSGRENTVLLEHEHIVNFLEDHDPDGAVRMLCDHLNRSDPLYTASTN
ncbi:MAG: transcriptional regulator NanR [Candidatus Thiodiazotropha sp.]